MPFDPEAPAPKLDPKRVDEPACEPDAALEHPGFEPPSLLSCLDAIGQLLRGGLFLLALLIPAVAEARAPAKVWINGNDIDGPPPGPEHVPQHLGGSIWGAFVKSKLQAERAGNGLTITDLESVTTQNGSVFGQYGYYWAQLDIIRIEQKTLDPFVLAGVGFAGGSTLGAASIVTRAEREMFRFDLLGGHYHVDFGFRYTISGASISNGVDRRTRNQGFLSPELSLMGVRVVDDTHAIHTRTSFASNGATTGKETSFEFLISYNTRVLETPDSRHDVAIGLRGLSTKLGFTDKGTGQETTYDEDFLGPELSYTYRW